MVCSDIKAAALPSAAADGQQQSKSCWVMPWTEPKSQTERGTVQMGHIYETSIVGVDQG